MENLPERRMVMQIHKIYKISGVIYELLPFINILSGVLLLSGISSANHIVVGIIQFIIGIFVLFMRLDCRLRKWRKDESAE